MVFIAGKTVWSMPERFKVVCIPYKALYKCSALPFTFIFHFHFQSQQCKKIIENNQYLTELQWNTDCLFCVPEPKHVWHLCVWHLSWGMQSGQFHYSCMLHSLTITIPQTLIQIIQKHRQIQTATTSFYGQRRTFHWQWCGQLATRCASECTRRTFHWQWCGQLATRCASECTH